MDNNTILFFKLWRNTYIKNEILFHLRLYNIYHNKPLKTKDYSKLKFKSYINKLIIGDDHQNTNVLVLKKGDLSNNLQSLTIGYNNIVFEDESLPNSLTSLSFTGDFDQKLNGSMFEDGCGNNLKSLDFGGGGSFDQPLDGWLPKNLEKLKLSYRFNQKIEKGQLPETLTFLGFGDYYNQPFDGEWLPKNIKTIVFGRSFEQPFKVSHHLPQSLTALILNDGYDEVIEPGAIPKSVSSMHYKIDVDRKYYSFSGVTNGVTSLEVIGGPGGEKLDFNEIPKNVTDLKLGPNIKTNIKKLPNNIRTFIYASYYEDLKIKENFLSTSLETLEINNKGIIATDENGNTDNNIQFQQLFPLSLTHLVVSQQFTIGYGGLDTFENLISLSLKNVSISAIQSNLPKNLTSLSIGYLLNDSNNVKEIKFPQSLTSLEFNVANSFENNDYFFDHDQDNNNNNLQVLLPLESIPISVTTLKLFGEFNQPLSTIGGSLPTTISCLELGKSFNQNIDISINQISNLKEITIRNQNFDSDISNDKDIQSSLQSINIHYRFIIHPINSLSSNQLFGLIKFIKDK